MTRRLQSLTVFKTMGQDMILDSVVHAGGDMLGFRHAPWQSQQEEAGSLPHGDFLHGSRCHVPWWLPVPKGGTSEITTHSHSDPVNPVSTALQKQGARDIGMKSWYGLLPTNDQTCVPSPPGSV